MTRDTVYRYIVTYICTHRFRPLPLSFTSVASASVKAGQEPEPEPLSVSILRPQESLLGDGSLRESNMIEKSAHTSYSYFCSQHSSLSPPRPLLPPSQPFRLIPRCRPPPPLPLHLSPSLPPLRPPAPPGRPSFNNSFRSPGAGALKLKRLLPDGEKIRRDDRRPFFHVAQLQYRYRVRSARRYVLRQQLLALTPPGPHRGESGGGGRGKGVGGRGGGRERVPTEKSEISVSRVSFVYGSGGWQITRQ